MRLQSPLRDEHLKLGAKLVDFGGWDMPLQYTGVLAEHAAVRQNVGLFDVSHLGKLIVEGTDATETLDRLLPGRVASLPVWKAGYNLVLNTGCGIVDDIFVYRHPDRWIVVPNASNSDAVKQVLGDHSGSGMTVTEGRERWAIIALSGPRARDTLVPIIPMSQDLKMHRFGEFDFEGMPAMIARTGYTGQFTFEFFVSWEHAPVVWQRLLQLGATPAGLGARDTLRLEMGYPLHGHEISEDTNPIEAGLEWVIEWDKDFLLRDDLRALKETGIDRVLVGMVAHGQGIPRAHHRVFQDGLDVGEVVSGNFSPVLGHGIAMGYVTPKASMTGTMLSIDVRGKMLPVEVTKRPFV
ncbi:MAG: glycine cleavage system aminomethyltransferase GcvT [Actinomycetota bacterium]